MTDDHALRQALAYARQLALLEPGNVELRQLVVRLEAETR